MPIAEDKALEILAELIKKPESKAEELPRIWNELMAVYNQHFAPVELPAKKRRRRSTNPNVGWPAGVGREEYKAWKTQQEAKGVTENLNPQAYKRLKESGVTVAAPAAAPASAPAAAGAKRGRKPKA